MPFCPQCGAEANGAFCARCGASFEGPAPSASASGPITENLAGALCYVLGLITGVVFLFLSPYNRNKFVRFHAFQSIFFNLAWMVVWAVHLTLMLSMPWAVMPVVDLLGVLLRLIFGITWVVLIVKAYQKERFKLPIIGDLAERQS